MFVALNMFVALSTCSCHRVTHHEPRRPGPHRLDFPLSMQALAGTTGELIWAGLNRLRGEVQAKIDRFIEALTELQDRRPTHIAVDQADSAGANDRAAARESFLRPNCHRTRVRCDGHQIHKTLLELISILGQLLRKMCKASNSLTMHGTFQNLRKQAAEYFKSKSNVTEEAPSYEAQRYGRACMEAMFGSFDQLTPLEAKRRVAVENILNGHLGDMDRILHHNGGDSVRMSKEELDRMIDLELIPALFPATVQLWNLARWNKN